MSGHFRPEAFLELLTAILLMFLQKAIAAAFKPKAKTAKGAKASLRTFKLQGPPESGEWTEFVTKVRVSAVHHSDRVSTDVILSPLFIMFGYLYHMVSIINHYMSLCIILYLCHIFLFYLYVILLYLLYKLYIISIS